MPKDTLRKVKWMLLFDSALKDLVVKAARRKGVHPVTMLEDLVREKFNPFGHTGVQDSAAYVTALRRKGRKQSDEAFLAETRAWQKSRTGSTKTPAFR
ncbi:MAG: hypothetical protein ABW047_16955 [Nitrospiraceae bacterium]